MIAIIDNKEKRGFVFLGLETKNDQLWVHVIVQRVV